MYCTYITFYSGNKMPPFYIGYSTISKVENGYRGSVLSNKFKLIWKQELTEQPNLFKTIVLTRHNNKKDALLKEKYFHQYFKVHRNPMYINMSIANTKFHCEGHTEESKKKMSDSRKGEKHHMFGKKHNEETKKKISASHKGKKLTTEHKKKLSEKSKGTKRTDATKELMSKIKIGNLNPFHGKKHSSETLEKIKKSLTKRYKIVLCDGTTIIIYGRKQLKNILNISEACAFNLFNPQKTHLWNKYGIENIEKL